MHSVSNPSPHIHLKQAKIKWNEYKEAGLHAGRCYLTDAINYLKCPLETGTADERKEATRLQASINLEQARLKFAEFKLKDLRADRTCCLAYATKYLEYTLTNGSEAEQQKATSLKATVYLEQAKLKWSEYDKNAPTHEQERYIYNTNSYLNHPLNHGTEAEIQQAKSLQATVNLAWSKLRWSDLPKHRSPTGQEGCMIDVTNFLRDTLKDGTDTERKEATSLQATVNLQRAIHQWNDLDKYTSRSGRECCMLDVANFLKYTINHGTEAEQLAATTLQATVNLERGKLEWSDLHRHISHSGQLGCLMQTIDYLSAPLKHGTEAEKQVAQSINASASLALAKLNLNDLHRYTSRTGREECLASASNYLKETAENGTESEQHQANSLLKTVEHEFTQLSL